jgi:hypothetical protein
MGRSGTTAGGLTKDTENSGWIHFFVTKCNTCANHSFHSISFFITIDTRCSFGPFRKANVKMCSYVKKIE